MPPYLLILHRDGQYDRAIVTVAADSEESARELLAQQPQSLENHDTLQEGELILIMSEESVAQILVEMRMRASKGGI